MAETMSPAFLSSVAAPQIELAVADLVDLWREKCRLSGNRPMVASEDIEDLLLDSIYSTAFGTNLAAGGSRLQLKCVREMNQRQFTTAVDELVEFPRATHPPVYDAITTIAKSVRCSLTEGSQPLR